ncbi:Zn-ribbon domain-containing OB-fold protein [Halomarina litorea]|uniref:Zn-ribbon domain-containing OB-fold protein n=1 Tax=Halomarina litorea TaxID=2961595 RepID=UPI0020C3329A|nr:Zn-ribbon domain-containing OB-fold protein [Halomarina sp. BCD28]
MSDDTPSLRGPLAPEDVTSDSPFTLPGFFDALAEGTLYGAVCEDCGNAMVPPRPACYGCGSRSVVAEEQPREGRVVSYTEVRTAPPAFAERAPYTVAVVELASGARLTGRVDADYESVSIDAPVELVVREPSAEEQKAALSYEEGWPVHEFELR